jgi:surface protein
MKTWNLRLLNARLYALGVGVIVTAGLLAGCDTVLQPEGFDRGPESKARFVLSESSGDAAGFYFIPPMRPEPASAGTFDTGLSPVVVICRFAGEGCAQTVATFTTDNSGSERVRLDAEDQHYIVNWHTAAFDLETGALYRVSVYAGSNVLLGYADARLVSTGRGITRTSDGVIEIVRGGTLPIKFRIETGIPGVVVVTPAEATIDAGGTQQFTATVSDLHGVPLSASVTWLSGETDVATVNASGLATGATEGTATITATAGPASGSALLNVIESAQANFTLAANGITIRCPNAAVGEKGFVNAVEYEAVDRALLTARRNAGADLSRLCTTAVTDMSQMFTNQSMFNQPIGNWDTGNVTNMNLMFSNATAFNQPIGNWDTGNVRNMSGMFWNATSFNQPIGSWNTGNVRNMSEMFYGSFPSNMAFNQPIGNWNTGNVTNMNLMFFRATSFNQPIGNWNTGSVREMGAMFNSATSFNQPIGNWNTGNVTFMSSMFWRATSFNQPIGSWNTAKVTTMSGLFSNATSFNQPIGNWDTGNVRNMSEMFKSAASFNQPIGNWDTGNVTNMNEMFVSATSFNQPIGSWNTAKVTTMGGLFLNATSFNQNLSYWCVSLITSKPSNFDVGATSWALPNSRPLWGTCPV